MKKLFVLFLCLCVGDSFASGIASNTNSAPCTNNTLETYSGNSNLSADWQPNEIQLRWYNNNTLMTVQEAANTCVYDGTLTVPSTAPTRVGYTFDGWQVRPEMDFSTITLITDGVSWSIDGPYNNNPFNSGTGNNCMYTTGMNSRVFGDCANSDYKDLQIHEWKAYFYGKTIYGTGKCSAKAGTNNNNTWDNASSNWKATYSELENASGDKKYCWCQLTGYKINKSDTVIYAPSKTIPWVFIYLYDNSCNSYCAMFCSANFISYTNLRNALLGITQ